MTGDPAAGDAFARQVADALYARDVTARKLGITVEAVGLGWSRLAMTVTADMVNGHAVAHGGYLFLLADTAMAYASNSHNQVALAQHAQITFIAPGKAGETLTATAREVSRSGRNGLYDIDVRGDEGRLIAAFRGATRTVRGQTDPELGDPPG